jgi:murein DD-endopeptidase MepM/ murein hydrolase activator NlpD
MKESRWTLMFVRDGGRAVHRVSAGPRRVRFALAALLLLLIGPAILGAGFAFGGVGRIQTWRLERENSLLEMELAEMRTRAEDLDAQLGILSGEGALFRMMAGLDSLDPDVLQVGIGGPGTPTPESVPLSQYDAAIGGEAFAVDFDLRALERRANLLLESLSEATDSLATRRSVIQSIPSILPAQGRLSSGFSSARLHPLYNESVPHEGLDISAPEGTPILASANGTVTFAGQKSGYGLVVEIDHGNGYETLYGHSSRVLVRKGQAVRRGQPIAEMGRTGIATGPHVHYEVHVNGIVRNPLNFVFARIVP